MNRRCRRRFVYGFACSICLFAVCAGPVSVSASIAGTDWNLVARHRSARVSDAPGGIFSARDTVSGMLAVTQELNRGLLTYRFGFGAVYAAQDNLGFIDGETGFRVYANHSGLRFLFYPADRLGAWVESEAGRIPLRDASGLIFSNTDGIEAEQLGDGVRFSMSWPQTRFDVSAVSLALLDDVINEVAPDNRTSTGLGTVILTGELQSALLAVEQTIWFTAVGTINSRTTDSRSDSIKTGFTVEGPIGSRVMHRTTAYGSWVAEADTNAADTAEPAFPVLLNTRLDLDAGVNWLSNIWIRMLYAGSFRGAAGFPAPAGEPVGTVYAEPPVDVLVAEAGAATDVAIGANTGRLVPDIAIRAIGVPSGAPGPRTGFDPGGQFMGIEFQQRLLVEPVTGFSLSAESTVLFGGPVRQSLLRFNGRLSI